MKFLHNIAKILIKDTNMTLKNFIRFASVNPARNLGVLEDFQIKEGLTPNFSVWDNGKIVPEKTFIK